MRLVQACFCAGKTSLGCFIQRQGSVKHVEASLSAREVRESSFHPSRGTVRLVQTCFCFGKT